MGEKKYLFLINCFLFVLLLLSTAGAVSVGVSPASLSFENVLRGGYAQNSLHVSTGAIGNLSMFFEFNGDIKDWLRIEDNLTNITVSSGNPRRVKVIVEPPDDIANGNYSGSVRVITDKLTNMETGIGSAVKAAFLVRISVSITGDEIRACSGGGLSLQDTEIDTPLPIFATIENEGNVRISPEIFVDVWDKYQREIVYSTILQTLSILPTESERIFKEMPHSLKADQYWVEIKVPDCNMRSILSADILEKGGISDQGQFLRIEHDHWAETGEIIPITAVFKNTGSRSVTASFKGEILYGGEIVKVIDTDKLLAAPGEVIRLQTFFRSKDLGEYTVSGRIYYNDKLSSEKGSVLIVIEESPGKIPEGLGIFYYLAFILIVAVLIVLILIKRKKHKIRMHHAHHRKRKF